MRRYAAFLGACRRRRAPDATGRLALHQPASELAAVPQDPEPALDPNDLVRDGIGPERWFDCLAAEVDGRLIGYAMVCRGYEAHMATRRLWLSDLDARRTGVGRALMVEIARLAIGQGCEAVYWDLWRLNRVGKAFLRESWSRRNMRPCHLACWQPPARGGRGRMTFAP